MLVGGLYLVSIYPERILFRVSTVQAASVALMIILGSSLFLGDFFARVRKGFQLLRPLGSFFVRGIGEGKFL